jgi:hypothetical protein
MRALPWLLLTISLGLNALWWTRRAPAVVAHETARPAPALINGGGASDARARRAAGLFGGVSPAVKSAPSPAAAATGTNAAAAPDDTLVQDVFCTIAEEKLREGWRRDREAILASLRTGLANRAEQDANVERNARELATALDLAPPALDDFSRRYRERRLERVDQARAAVERTPPDFGGLLVAVEGLFSDEDALARDFAGAPGFERVRAQQLEGRAQTLAIAATLADQPLPTRW